MKTRKYQSLILSLLGILGLSMIGLVFWQMSKGHQWKTYEDPHDHFRMKYPSDWNVQEDTPGVAVVFLSPLANSLDRFAENVTVVIQEMPNMHLEDYTEKAIKQMQVVFEDSIEIVQKVPTYLSGHRAYRFVYLGKAPQEKKTYTLLHVWTIIDNKAYQVNFTSEEISFADYINIVDQMIASFRVL